MDVQEFLLPRHVLQLEKWFEGENFTAHPVHQANPSWGLYNA